jgi:hypothetical protein
MTLPLAVLAITSLDRVVDRIRPDAVEMVDSTASRSWTPPDIVVISRRPAHVPLDPAARRPDVHRAVVAAAGDVRRGGL